MGRQVPRIVKTRIFNATYVREDRQATTSHKYPAIALPTRRHQPLRRSLGQLHSSRQVSGDRRIAICTVASLAYPVRND
jgi:hypothetical protein